MDKGLWHPFYMGSIPHLSLLRSDGKLYDFRSRKISWENLFEVVGSTAPHMR